MTKLYIAVSLCCLAAFAIGCNQESTAPATDTVSEPVQETPAASPEQVAIANDLVAALARGDMAAATANFDATMTDALPAAQLAEVWNALPAQAGPFRNVTGTRTEKVQGFDVVFVTCQFGRGLVDVQVTFNADNQVSGLFFRPAGQ